MSPWLVARAVALLILLVVLIVATRRDPRFLPLLAFACWMVVIDVLRGAIEGIRYDHRLLLHVDQGLYLSVYFAFLWACAELFRASWGRWLALAAWFTLTVTLVAIHGDVHGEHRAYVYAGASLVTLAGCWTAILRAVLARPDVQPGLAHLAAMVLVAGDTVVSLHGFIDLAPGGVDALAASWDVIRAVNVLSLGLSTIICGARLLRP